jgi:hypothetical protein
MRVSSLSIRTKVLQNRAPHSKGSLRYDPAFVERILFRMGQRSYLLFHDYLDRQDVIRITQNREERHLFYPSPWPKMQLGKAEMLPPRPHPRQCRSCSGRF